MSTNKDETLRQFCEVTGADESRSKFFLESSNWQLEVALSSFYENGGVNIDDHPSSASPMVPPLSDDDMDSPEQSPALPQKKDKKKSKSPFVTLNELQDSSSEEEEGEAFYAGGSERSGQQILGPGKGRKDIVTEMFKSVKERGAVVFEEDASGTSHGRGGGSFSGVGYRLGQTADDHEKVNTSTGAPAQPQVRSVRLRLFREGFTVDSGPLRRYTDPPENAEFLGCIRRGEIPPELQADGGGEVRLSLEDHRHDDCPRPPPRHQPFTGKGHLLGSPTPPTVGVTSPVLGDGEEDREANHRAAQDALKLDEAQPLTTVQFRLADGSRLAGRFNHSHTVADLHAFVQRAEPRYQLQPFTLLTSYPSAELADRAATIAAANLLNTTLLQRLK